MEVRTEGQLEALRRRRNTELKSVLDLDPGFTCQGEVGKFVGLYLQAEVFARKLQSYYRTDAKKDGNDALQIQVIKAAIRHFGVSFKEKDVDCLFKGGPGKRGEKTARQLRNGYLHSLSPEDKQEIAKSGKLLSARLSEFLSIKL